MFGAIKSAFIQWSYSFKMEHVSGSSGCFIVNIIILDIMFHMMFKMRIFHKKITVHKHLKSPKIFEQEHTHWCVQKQLKPLALPVSTVTDRQWCHSTVSGPWGKTLYRIAALIMVEWSMKRAIFCLNERRLDPTAIHIFTILIKNQWSVDIDMRSAIEFWHLNRADFESAKPMYLQNTSHVFLCKVSHYYTDNMHSIQYMRNNTHFLF